MFNIGKLIKETIFRRSPQASEIGEEIERVAALPATAPFEPSPDKWPDFVMYMSPLSDLEIQTLISKNAITADDKELFLKDRTALVETQRLHTDPDDLLAFIHKYKYRLLQDASATVDQNLTLPPHRSSHCYADNTEQTGRVFVRRHYVNSFRADASGDATLEIDMRGVLTPHVQPNNRLMFVYIGDKSKPSYLIGDAGLNASAKLPATNGIVIINSNDPPAISIDGRSTDHWSLYSPYQEKTFFERQRQLTRPQTARDQTVRIENGAQLKPFSGPYGDRFRLLFAFLADDVITTRQIASELLSTSDLPKEEQQIFRRMVKFIDTYCQPGQLSPKDVKLHKDVTTILKGLISGTSDISDLYRIASLAQAAHESVAERINVFSSFRNLGLLPIFEQASQLGQALSAYSLGTTPKALLESTYNFGPIYNRLNEAGYLIPGSQMDDIEGRYGEPGLGKLLGIRGTKDGDIEFRFDAVSEHGPYILSEDIQIALALAFGGRKPILPWFSLPFYNKKNANGDLVEKQWEPHWLENTAFGETLYATDYWMGYIADGKHKAFYLGLEPAMALSANEIFSDMVSARDQPRAFDLRIKPDRVELSKDVSRLGDITLGVLQVKMEVMSSYRRSLRHWFRDKTRYGECFEKHYERIAELFPVYERLRQLAALVGTLTELQRCGFKPNRQMREQIDFLYKRFNKIPKTRRTHRLGLWQ